MTEAAELATTEIPQSIRKWRSYPEYNDSGVEGLDIVPSQWEIRRFKYVCRMAYGDSLPTEQREDGEVPVLGSNGVVGSHITSNTLAPVIVIGRKGSYGKVTYSEKESFAIDTTYFVDPRYTCTNIRWLYYASNTLGLDEFSEDSAIPGLSRDYVYQRYLVVPPHDEQQTIAAFLDRETAKIDTLIAKKQRLIELLQEKRTALISHAVTKGLDPNAPMKDSGIEWLGENPAHWQRRRLKFLTSFVTSGSRGWAQHYADEGALFIRIGNLSRNSIELNLDDVQYVQPPAGSEGERTKIQIDDILVSITAYVGTVAVIPLDIGEAYVNQHVALVRPIQRLAFPRWVAYCLHSGVGWEQFQLLLYGGTKEGLGLDDLEGIEIILPPMDEQRTIASYLDRNLSMIDALIGEIGNQIKLLREYRTALISAAVTGNIDVRDEVSAV